MTRLLRLTSLLLVTALTACTAGTVEIDGADPFGPVRSAVDLEIQWDLGSGAEVSEHLLVYTTQANFCSHAQEALPAGQEIFDTLLDDLEDVTSWDVLCLRWRALWFDLEAAYEPMLHEGQNLGFVWLEDVDEGSVLGAPSSGSWPLTPPETGPWAFATVERIHSNPYEEARGFGCGDLSPFNGSIRDYYLDSRTFHYVAHGELVLEELAPTRSGGADWAVHTEDAIYLGDSHVDGDGWDDERGSFELDATFSHCPVPIEVESSPFVLL